MLSKQKLKISSIKLSKLLFLQHLRLKEKAINGGTLELQKKTMEKLRKLVKNEGVY